jgi:hypothetical protein
MITLDWDNTSVKDFEIKIGEVLSYLNKYYDNKPEVYYRQSSNKEGYHVKILGVENNYSLRAIFGDDEKRLKLDIMREKEGLPINVLFTKKIYPDGSVKEAGEWQRIQ